MEFFGLYANNYNKSGSRNDGRISSAPLLLSGLMIGASIPIKKGFSKKIKQAIDLANQDLMNRKTSYIESTEIIVNSNGLGLAITF